MTEGRSLRLEQFVEALPSTCAKRLGRSTSESAPIRLRSSAIPPAVGTAAPHTPLPAPNGTTAAPFPAAKRTIRATSSVDEGQATTSGGWGVLPARVQRSARGQQSRDMAHRSDGSQETAPFPTMAARSRSSALPRAVAAGRCAVMP